MARESGAPSSTAGERGNTWPSDVHGKVAVKQVLGNKRVLIALDTHHGRRITVRLGTQLDQNSVLSQIELGRSCAIYNLNRCAGSADAFEETPFTLVSSAS